MYQKEANRCAECGQACEPQDFHDYGACLLYKAGYDIKHTLAQYEAWKTRRLRQGKRGGG